MNNIARTDMHSLMLADDGYNFGRSNKFYDNCSVSCTERETDINNGEGGGIGVYPGNSNWYDSDSYEVWNFRKGDVARAMFYMAVRYEGSAIDEVDLELTDDPLEIVVDGRKMGLLSILLE